MADDDLPFRFVPPADPNLGRIVEGHSICELLGKGGMGAAYLAIHTALRDNRCVIKLVLRELASHPQALARFQQEAWALSVLKHEHIVRLENVGVLDDGQLYLRFEFIDGQALNRYLAAQGGRLPLRKAVEFVFQICSAMSFAHDKDIVHRDLKPENLMVEFNPPGSPLKERIQVLDFGIAKVAANMSDATGSGMALGTARFMAPEQVTDAASVSGKADVFSLGQILFLMLTGKLPWGTPESDIAIYHKQRTEAPATPPESLVPREVARVIMRCLSLNPDDRPTMRELAVELACAIPARRGLESGTEILKRIVPDWVKSSPHNGRTLPQLPATDPSVAAGPPSIRDAVPDGARDDVAAVPAAIAEVASGSEPVAAEVIAAAPPGAAPALVGDVPLPPQPATANARPRPLAASLASAGSARVDRAAAAPPPRPPDSPAAELEGDSTERQAWTPLPSPILAALPTGLPSLEFTAPAPPPEDRAPSIVVAAEIDLATGTPAGPRPYAHAELPPVVVSMTQLGQNRDARAPVREAAPFIVLPDAQPTKLSAATKRRKLAWFGVAACTVVAIAVFTTMRFSSPTAAGGTSPEPPTAASHAPAAADAMATANGSTKRSNPGVGSSEISGPPLPLARDAAENRVDTTTIHVDSPAEQVPLTPNTSSKETDTKTAKSSMVSQPDVPVRPAADDIARAASGSGSLHVTAHPTRPTEQPAMADSTSMARTSNSTTSEVTLIIRIKGFAEVSIDGDAPSPSPRRKRVRPGVHHVVMSGYSEGSEEKTTTEFDVNVPAGHEETIVHKSL